MHDFTVGADIDTLCVAPRHVERADFFGSFYDLLKEQNEVKDLRVSRKLTVEILSVAYTGHIIYYIPPITKSLLLFIIRQ